MVSPPISASAATSHMVANPHGLNARRDLAEMSRHTRPSPMERRWCISKSIFCFFFSLNICSNWVTPWRWDPFKCFTSFWGLDEFSFFLPYPVFALFFFSWLSKRNILILLQYISVLVNLTYTPVLLVILLTLNTIKNGEILNKDNFKSASTVKCGRSEWQPITGTINYQPS